MAETAAKALELTNLKRQQEKAIGELLNAALQAYEARRFAEAQFICGQVLTVRPDHFDALSLLGITQLDSGEKEAAERTLRQALAIEPQSAEAHCNHGVALFELRRYEEAGSAYERAIAIKPYYSTALNNLGNVWQHLGHARQALTFYDQAIKVDPKYADAWSNCGSARLLLGQFDEAERCLTEALRLNPRLVEAVCNLGRIELARRDYSKARSYVVLALQLGSNHPWALLSLGWLRMGVGDFIGAHQDCEAALALAPTMRQALVVCSDAALQAGNSLRAAELAEQLLQMEPDNPRALTVLGACKASWGDPEGALVKFNEAIDACPHFEPAIVHKIFVLDFIPQADFAVHQAARRQWWERIGSPQRRCVLGPVDRNPDRQLRVGYVSSDLREHSAGIPMLAVFRAHDHARFHITAYACSITEDEVTNDFRAAVDSWVNAAEMSDERLAAKVLSDKIDILVDMSGHTSGNRLRVFARKPAPIQVSAWGSGGGTGIPLVDYLLNDQISIPEFARSLHAEKVADLPCQITMAPITLPISDLPMQRKGYVTFGVFNRIDKISEAAALLWSRILAALPEARLVIKHGALDQAAIRASLLKRLEAGGIATERVTLLGKTSRLDHLLAFGEIDISLDPFPLNGGASTWESLYMGVPVVTKLGKTQASRAAGAINSAVGLSQFVAADDNEYAAIAQHWATRPGDLAALRRDIRAKIANSDAGDPVRYCGHVETLYRRFWTDYCALPATDDPGPAA